MQRGRFPIERNGARIKPQASALNYSLDTAVVVVDVMTNVGNARRFVPVAGEHPHTSRLTAGVRASQSDAVGGTSLFLFSFQRFGALVACAIGRSLLLRLGWHRFSYSWSFRDFYS